MCLGTKMFLLLLLLPLSSCDIHITEFTSFPLASSDWTSSTPITTSDTSMIQCGIQCADKLRKDGSCNAFRFDQGTCQVAKVHIGVDLNTIAETVFSKGGTFICVIKESHTRRLLWGGEDNSRSHPGGWSEWPVYEANAYNFLSLMKFYKLILIWFQIFVTASSWLTKVDTN